MRITGEHDDALDVVTADLVVEDFIGAFLAELDETMAADDDELFPLGVVPVLSLGDARLADVDGYLSALGRMDEFGEGTSLVDIHLQVEDGFLFRQVAEVGRIEFLGEGVGWNLGDHQRLRHGVKLMQQFHYLAKGHLMGHHAVAISSRCRRDDVESLELAMMFLAFKGIEHLIDQVVDIEQFQFHARVVDGDREVVGDVVAEGGDSAVVVRAAPFAEEVREAVYQDLHALFFAIFQEELLPCLLAAAVFRVAEAACQRGLLRGGEHDGTSVAMLLQGVEQCGGEAEVAFHELALFLGAVHPCQVEDEVGLGTVCIEQHRVGVDVVFEDLFDMKVGTRTVFAFLYINKVRDKVLADEAFGACDEYFHILFASDFFCFGARLQAEVFTDEVQLKQQLLHAFHIETCGVMAMIVLHA